MVGRAFFRPGHFPPFLLWFSLTSHLLFYWDDALRAWFSLPVWSWPAVGPVMDPCLNRVSREFLSRPWSRWDQSWPQGRPPPVPWHCPHRPCRKVLPETFYTLKQNNRMHWQNYLTPVIYNANQTWKLRIQLNTQKCPQQKAFRSLHW